MDPKPRPNHAKYIEVLRSMTSEQRLNKAFELSDLTRQLFFARVWRADFRTYLLKSSIGSILNGWPNATTVITDGS